MRRFVFLAFGWAAVCVIVTLAGVVLQSTWHGAAVQAQAPGYASRIVPQPALPANCLPENGDVVYLTTGNIGLYACTDTNVWTQIDRTGMLNVKAFGAKGNNIADDTVAIQAALTAAGTPLFTTVFFPQGTYKTSDSLLIPVGVSLEGVGVAGSAGLGSSVLVCSHATHPAIKYTGGFFFGSTISKMILQSAAGGTIQIDGVSAIRIFNVILNSAGGPDLLFTGLCAYVQIDHCEISAAVVPYNTYAVQVSATGTVVRQLVIEDNQIGGGTVAMISIKQNSGFITSRNNQYVGSGPAAPPIAILVDGDPSAGGGISYFTSIGDYFDHTFTTADISINPDAYATNPPVVNIFGDLANGGSTTPSWIICNPLVSKLTAIENTVSAFTGFDIALGNMTGTAATYHLVSNQLIDASKISGTNPTPNAANNGDFVFRELIFSQILFADLGTPVNGTVYFCTDCTVASPCATGGTGALAKRMNGAWVCN